MKSRPRFKRKKPDERVRAYWKWLKTRRCAACEGYGTHADPIEVAHIRGVYSDRTRDLSYRSHLGMQGWAALPLHRSCHEELHRIGEHRYINTIVAHPHARLATNLLQWFLVEEQEGDDDGEDATS